MHAILKMKRKYASKNSKIHLALAFLYFVSFSLSIPYSLDLFSSDPASLWSLGSL